ncbi:hypothetical protein ACWGCW_28080 [Streptomyces sp. NPDC054933]
MAEYDFPDDLRTLQTDLEAARAELAALYGRLPHRSMAMPEPYVDVRGIQHPASPGWTDEEHQAVDALWARQRELSAAITWHPFFSTLTGPDRPVARMALKHLNDGADG